MAMDSPRVIASPDLRRLARQRGDQTDLEGVLGTGRDRRHKSGGNCNCKVPDDLEKMHVRTHGKTLSQYEGHR